MTRTQISLEERQYRFLKKEAERRGTSMSAVLRTLVDAAIHDDSARGPSIMSLRGAFSDGGVTGAEHDHRIADAIAERKVAGEGPEV